MFVFGSIFGKNRLGKGLQGVAMFSLAAPRARRIPARPVAVSPMAARPETEHNISGAHPRTLSPQGCQSGRTLLEMLAVLAIIGILSVAALAGLMWAMAKYRANDTIHDVHLWQLAALDSNQLFDMTSGQLTLPELGSVSTHGYPMAVWIQDKDVFTVHVNDVPKRVCSLMLDMIDENQTLTVNDVRFNNDDICTNDINTLVFYMNKDMGNVGSICIPSCEEGETCCGGECQVIMTPCGTDGCTDCGGDYCTTSNTCCPTPTATKCGDTDCCDTKCCNGVCCPESYMTCDATTTCGCPNNMVPDADTGACKCPDDAPYFFEEAGICCKSGYTPVEGVCQQIKCTGGPTDYSCFINNLLCGTKCDSTGRNCERGVCYVDACPNGYPFVQMEHQWYWGGGEGFGCAIKNTPCYTSPNETNCWENNTGEKHACCTASLQGECTSGLCDSSVCSQFVTETQTSVYGHTAHWGYCLFNDATNNLSKVYCIKNETTWTCSVGALTAYGGISCGTCATPPCPDCSKEACSLLGTNVYTDENGQCCKDFEKGTICSGLSSKDVYLKKDDTYDKCGYNFNWETGNQAGGDCFPVTCPEGTEWGSVYGLYYGCLNPKTGVGCIRSNAIYECFTSATTSCGSPCQNADGSECSNYQQEACAPLDEETGKRLCIYGKPVTETCLCDTDKTLTVGALCCAPGQQNVNGTCSVISG